MEKLESLHHALVTFRYCATRLEAAVRPCPPAGGDNPATGPLRVRRSWPLESTPMDLFFHQSPSRPSGGFISMRSCRKSMAGFVRCVSSPGIRELRPGKRH